MIFKASSEHVEILSTLGAETFYASHKDSAPAQEIFTYMRKIYTLESIRKELTNSSNIYHLIEHESKIVGFSKIAFDMGHPSIQSEHVSKMNQIYLLEPFHGLRLGTKLLNYNIELSTLNGQTGMWLIVWVGNTTAITFYKRHNFSIVKQDQFHLTGSHVSPCYIMFLDYKATRII
ncbi:MAG: GNAT family N-acetyltransferase [Cyclobacteriaceae bacterium]|nr:GNAT family N-acetyltransferase [Cyclobacteriaceae bacterium]